MKNSTNIITRILLSCFIILTTLHISAQVLNINKSALNTSTSDSNVTYVGHFPFQNCRWVAIKGNTAFLTGGTVSGPLLKIVDVSNPALPTEISEISLPTAPIDIKVSGNYVYFADADSGLIIMDVSNPAAPQEVGSFALDSTGSSAAGVYINGNYAYIAVGGPLYSIGKGGLYIIDVSNPAAPQEVGSFDKNYSFTSVSVSGSIAYATEYYGKLFIINISNPGDPYKIDSLKISNYTSKQYLSGNYVYSTDNNGLKITDVSNPSAPNVAAYFSATYGRDVFVSGNYAYLTNGSGGLHILDVSNPAKPIESGFYGTGGYNTLLGVAVNGIYTYVADASNGLSILRNDLLTDVKYDKRNLPTDFSLSQNHPNPFDSQTEIDFGMPTNGFVTLDIYDFSGRKVANLINKFEDVGVHHIKFDASKLKAGLYFYRLTIKTASGNFVTVKKMILEK